MEIKSLLNKYERFYSNKIQFNFLYFNKYVTYYFITKNILFSCAVIYVHCKLVNTNVSSKITK